MKEIICVGSGGCIGASIRYLITKYLGVASNSSIPVGTLFVNVLGGFLIGLITEISVSTDLISPDLKLFLTTGIMGGLTTFSTFSYETIALISSGKYLSGILNIFLNVFLSLAGVALAMTVFKKVI